MEGLLSTGPTPSSFKSRYRSSIVPLPFSSGLWPGLNKVVVCPVCLTSVCIIVNWQKLFWIGESFNQVTWPLRRQKLFRTPVGCRRLYRVLAYELLTNNAVCRTALTTTGLLISKQLYLQICPLLTIVRLNYILIQHNYVCVKYWRIGHRVKSSWIIASDNCGDASVIATLAGRLSDYELRAKGTSCCLFSSTFQYRKAVCCISAAQYCTCKV